MAENRRHAEKSEDRRIFITAVTVVTALAALIAMPFVPHGSRSLLAPLWLAVVGAAATVLCLKLHERAEFHEERARDLRRRIAEMSAVPADDVAQHDIHEEHARRYPRLSRVRLNTVLVALNLTAAALGLLSIGFAIVSAR